jgi:hypothetical protein
MFDLTTISQAPDGGIDEHWTVVLFQQTRLPVFACIPKSWSTLGDRRRLSSVSLDPEVGDQMTRQAVADFQKAYELCVPTTAVRSTEDEVRRLFRAPRLEALARCPGWYVQSSGKCLLFARSGTAPAADRPALWREAIEIRQALLAPESSAVMPIPVAPGPERDRQGSRQSDRSRGRLTGAVLGFFVGVMAFIIFMFSQMGPAGPGHRASALHLMPVVFFGSILGGLLIGTVVGTWLGGRLADRSYEPVHDSAPAPKVGRRKPRSRPHRDNGSSRIEDEVCSWLTKDADANDRDRPRELPDQERDAAEPQGQPSGADSLANSASDARAPTALPAESPRWTRRDMFAPYAWDTGDSVLLAFTLFWNAMTGFWVFVKLSGALPDLAGWKGWLVLSPFILIGVILFATQVASLIRAVRITRADKLARSRLGCEVRLICPVNGVSGIPTEGKNLIIVAAVDHVLHVRVFDSYGKPVVDTDENRPTGQARQFENLRKQLENLWPPHELTGVDKGRVIAAVTSIVGRTPWT